MAAVGLRVVPTPPPPTPLYSPVPRKASCPRGSLFSLSRSCSRQILSELSAPQPMSPERSKSPAFKGALLPGHALP